MSLFKSSKGTEKNNGYAAGGDAGEEEVVDAMGVQEDVGIAAGEGWVADVFAAVVLTRSLAAVVRYFQ